MQSLKPWFDRHGDQRPQLVNMYGITETTVHVTYRPLSTTDLTSGSVIGIPIPDMQVYILDRQRQLAPIGIVGEMFVGGAGLSRGYLNRPELTSEKFIDNPFSDKPGERLYRSGDLARYLPSGDIEYLGRIDDQVKIRGFRIELGEIESVLCQHAAVREASVVAREDESREKRLVAYVVAKGPAEPNVSELREFLKERLPDYMVPWAFVTLERFPLTPNGKVDRRALPQPDIPSSPAGFEPPVSAAEKALAKIWAQVLNVKQVGRHDNFFALGGHSLLVVRATAEINRVLKANVRVGEVFANPTIRQLAKAIDERQPMERGRHGVITLQAGDAGPAVYFIMVSHEFRLARLFGEGRPVFAIEGPLPTKWLTAAAKNQVSALPTMEEFVAPYVAALHAHAGDAPCILAGFCQAGYLAFEAAYQFKRQGGNVESVILFDVFAKKKISLGSGALLRLRQIQKEAPSWSAARFSEVGGYYARALWLKNRRLFSRAADALRSTLVHSPEEEEQAPFFDEQGATISWRAWIRWLKTMHKSYAPRCLDSRGVLVRSVVQQDLHPAYSSLFWKDLFSQGIEVIDVSEGHLSLARDAEKALALKLKMGDLLNGPYANHVSET